MAHIVDGNILGEKPINVIIAPCGAGKTSFAIQLMQESQGPFIFVTPYRDEIVRILNACKDAGFVQPVYDNQSKTLRESFKRLLADGRNIATTHELFRKADQETTNLIRNGGYTLILDEVMNVLEQIKESRQDVEMLFNEGYLCRDESGNVIATEKCENYEGKFSTVVQMAQVNRLIYFDDTMLFWRFPAKVLQSFHAVYNLTYMFDGQIQRCYYDLYNLMYRRHSLAKTRTRYELAPYTPQSDIGFRGLLRGKVGLYSGKLNALGDASGDLSVNWYKRMTRRNHRQVGTNIRKVFRSWNAKMDSAMWTCFSDYKSTVARGTNGFTSCHVAHNARATNEYRDKEHLAYCVNRFMQPTIKNFLESRGVQVNQDEFALSELIQWVCRSRIRDGKPIKLYLPSSRMRGLYKSWLSQ